MALFCTQYLISHPFKFSVERDIQACALTGYYGFHDYAAAFWWNHVDKLVESREEVSLDAYHGTLQSVAKMLRAYLKSTSMREEELRDLDAIERRFKDLPRNHREREKAMSLELSTEILRDAIEAIQDRGDEICTADETKHLPLYGCIRYKCPKPWCQLFSTGFENLKQRKDHVNEHERPFRCSAEGCPLMDIGFSTESNLAQHMKRHHTQPEISLFPKPRQSGKREGDIFDAVKEGDLNRVKELVTSGNNINVLKGTTRRAWTPLMLAVEYGHLNVCEYLLEMGADPNVSDIVSGETILHAAVRRNDFDIVDLLLKQDIINAEVLELDRTAPNLAAALGYNNLLRLFKARKPQSFDLRSCLGEAVTHNQIRTVQMLLRVEKTSTFDLDWQYLISTLSEASDDMIRIFLSFKGSGNDSRTGSKAILQAAWDFKDANLLLRLISTKCGLGIPDKIGKSAGVMELLKAVSKCKEDGGIDVKGIKLILKEFLAMPTEHMNGIIDVFLEFVPSLATQSDLDGATLLHHAVYRGDVKLVRLLIQMDVDVSARLQSYPPYWLLIPHTNPASVTPLALALELGFVSICQLLVASDKIDLRSLDLKEGLKYLNLAAKLRNERLASSLVQRGLLFSLRGSFLWDDRVSQLMVVVANHFEMLLEVATDKNQLVDTLAMLMSSDKYSDF